MKITDYRVVLIDMSIKGNTSGVDRYLKMLVNGLREVKGLELYWISLVSDKEFLSPSIKTKGNYTKQTIPLPIKCSEIIQEFYWGEQYYQQVYRLVAPNICRDDKPCILHLHTLNLIDLALLFKQDNPNYKIITHLHCIPWKSYLNSNPKHFNELYAQWQQGNQDKEQLPNLMTTHSELRSYEKADKVIALTECAKDLVLSVSQQKNIKIIPNGLMDFKPQEVKGPTNSQLHLLYVGIVSPSKGLKYILEAISIVQKQGYNVKLSVAGKCNEVYQQELIGKHKGLNVDFLGLIPFEELLALYQSCDAGIIASMQEQCSYVAIEMMMMGMPIITTAVDGLDEMFTDELNALKVPLLFSPVFGLSVDTYRMAEQIIRLGQAEELRAKLAKNTREEYLKKYQQDMMIQQMLSVYQEVIM